MVASPLLRVGKGIFLLWIVLGGMVSPLGAGVEEEALFRQGTLLYEQGRFDEALHSFRLLLDRGMESGSLHYNLGNCFLQKGELGKALLSYERAKRLGPLDRDLRGNEAYVRTLLRIDRSDVASWDQGVIDFLFGAFSTDGLILVLSALYGLCLLTLVGSWFYPRVKSCRLWLLLLWGSLFLLASVAFLQRVPLWKREAIILVDRVATRYQPFDRAPVHFFLREGTKVTVVRDAGSWVKVERGDRKAGWVRKSAMELL